MPRCLPALAGLAAALCTLMACEPYDTIQTWVVLDAETDRFQVHARIENVTQEFFECQDVAPCAASVLALLSGEPTARATQEVWKLPGEGATDLRIRLEPEGDSLNVLIWYSAWPGSRAAERTGVHLELIGRVGRPPTKHLVVAWDERRHIVDPGKVERRVRWRPDGGDEAEAADIVAEQSWVLGKKVTQVKVVEKPAPTGTNTPLFAAVPGLREALQGRGVL